MIYTKILKERLRQIMSTENCVMCGKPHAGKYVVCGACITEFNLTQDQIEDMGGLRQIEPKTKSSSLDSAKKNTVSNTEKIHKEAGSLSTAYQKTATTQSLNPSTNAQADPYINLITKLTKDVNTIKSILLFYFVFTVIGMVIYILALVSASS